MSEYARSATYRLKTSGPPALHKCATRDTPLTTHQASFVTRRRLC